MSMITVQVWDATGNKRTEVELPNDAPVNRILVVLLDKMSLPRNAPDGQPLSYKFHHKASGIDSTHSLSRHALGTERFEWVFAIVRIRWSRDP